MSVNTVKNKSRKYKGIPYRARQGKWQVDYGTQYEGKIGKRTQLSYETLDEAKLAIDDHKERLRVRADDRRASRIQVYDLTEAQRLDVVGPILRLVHLCRYPARRVPVVDVGED